MIVYQTDSYNMTPLKAAQEFARNYFEDKREIIVVFTDSNYLEFQLVNGNATYQVKFNTGIHLQTVSTYQIKRL